jgi:methionyl-tRNA formyltransferase
VRVVFFGNSPPFSTALLRAVARQSSLAAIVCPRRRGTSRSLRQRLAARLAPFAARLPLWPESFPLELNRLARAHGAALLFPGSVNDPAAVAEIRHLGAELAIVAGLDHIFTRESLDALPPLVNVHPSLLPDLRGPVPCFWAVRLGYKETGVSLHRIDPGIDTGEILEQRRIVIDERWTADDLKSRCAALGAAMVADLLRSGGRGDSQPQGLGGRYLGKPRPEDRTLDGSESAEQALRRLQAWGPRASYYVHVPADGPRQAWTSPVAFWHLPGPRSVRVELVGLLGVDSTGSLEPGTLGRLPDGAVRLGLSPGQVTFRRMRAARDHTS